MLELLFHKRKQLITTVVDGSICTSNHMFMRAIWDKLPLCIFEDFQISHQTLYIETNNFLQQTIKNQRAGNYKITSLTVQC